MSARYFYSNRQSTLSPLAPFLSLPKYFDSEWSYAQYRIPSQTAHFALSAGTSGSKLSDAVEDERCVVSWIKLPSQSPAISSSPTPQAPQFEYQLIALTYSGGWYRLALPSSLQTSKDASASEAMSLPSPVHSQRPRSIGGSSVTGRTRTDKGKRKEQHREVKDGRDCILKEFRRYGRWDGWG